MPFKLISYKVTIWDHFKTEILSPPGLNKSSDLFNFIRLARAIISQESEFQSAPESSIEPRHVHVINLINKDSPAEIPSWTTVSRINDVQPPSSEVSAERTDTEAKSTTKSAVSFHNSELQHRIIHRSQ